MTLLALLILVAGPIGSETRESIVVTQLLIRQRTIVRVPMQPQPPERVTRWHESRGPKCVDMRRVGGAAVMSTDSVDLLLRGGERVRAQFEDSCPDLSYYAGFYIRPGADGQLCADRDSIRTRDGGECAVERFRRLTPDTGGRVGVIERIRRRLGRH